MIRLQPIGRYEFIALVAALLVGFILRVVMLDRVEIDHFDEGVYSSNMWFAETPDGHYPMRHLYAPPLLPAAIECCQVFLGPTTLAGLLPSLITGCLTVFLVWFVLRKWYGSDAALIGVWLAAMSDFHVIYSQMALTDVPMGFFLLLAVGLGVEAILRGGIAQILLAGVATGLAWWTKYNGWLPLAILASGTVAWLVIHRPKTVTLGKAGLRLALIAGVAFAVWAPVWFGLQDKGGYAAVAANHRGYLNPLSEWSTALTQQVINHRLLESPMTWFSLPVSMLVAGLLLALFDSRFTWKPIPAGGRRTAIFRIVLGLLVLGGISMLIGTSPTLAVVAIGGLLGSLVWPVRVSHESAVATQSRNADPGDRRRLATWIVTAWLIGMFVATPAYRPYPRLSLPLLIAVWLGAAVALAWWVRAVINVARKSTKPGVHYGSTFLTVFLGVSLLMNLATGSPTISRPVAADLFAENYGRIVRQIDQKMAETKFVAFTYGEPALMHLLNSAGHPATPTTALVSSPTPGFEQLVIVGDQARRSADFASQWSANSHRLELLVVERFQPSDVVALNDPATAKTLWNYRRTHGRIFPPATEPPETRIEVFRVIVDH